MIIAIIKSKNIHIRFMDFFSKRYNNVCSSIKRKVIWLLSGKDPLEVSKLEKKKDIYISDLEKKIQFKEKVIDDQAELIFMLDHQILTLKAENKALKKINK